MQDNTFQGDSVIPISYTLNPTDRKLAAMHLLLGFSLSSRQHDQKRELFQDAARTAMQMTGAKASYLYLRQRTAVASERLGESVYYQLEEIFNNYSSPDGEDLPQPLSQPLIEKLAIQQKIIRQADSCRLSIPIHQNGKMMALLDLVHSDNAHFDEIDVELMEHLAQQIAASLQSQHIITTRTAQIELAQYLSAELDLAILLNKVAQSAARIANAQASSILLIQPEGTTMRFASVYGLDETERETLRQLLVPLEGSLAGFVATSGQPVMSNDARSDPRWYMGISNNLAVKTRSLLAVPMLVGDKAIGALEVINHHYGDGFDDTDSDVLTLFASQAAIAIQNARLLAERQASVTELTKLEQRKSQFIALASHELRTPLSLISGYTDILHSSLSDLNIMADHEAFDFLSQVEQATDRLTEMVNNIASLYNLETGRTKLLLERLNVIESVRAVTREYAEWARKKGIEFRLRLEDQPTYAICDPSEVRRILGNLISNAVKFTPEGGQITVHAQYTPSGFFDASPSAEENQVVMISIADTGPGIREDQLNSVFERFSQIGNHLSRTQGGIGLGLPLAKWLVEKHGGHLWLERNSGTGAVFHFTLPAAKQ